MKNVLKRLLQKTGWKLTTQNVPFDMVSDDPYFLELYTRCKPFSMTSIECMYALYKGIEYIVKNRIPGDIVECGVWRGGSSMLAALALKRFGDINRKIYLYDTYAGMAEPTIDDVRRAEHASEAHAKWSRLQKESHNDWCYATLQEVRDRMVTTGYPESNFCFVKGLVENTIPQTMPEKIALLRLDTDWYVSTKYELQHLFPILLQNGLLIIDDYGHWAGAKKAVDEFFEVHPIYLARIDQTGRVGIKTSLP